jgi:hypothetical protein
MPSTDPLADTFRYRGVDVDPALGIVRCTYATSGHTFTETFDFGPDGDWSHPAVDAAVRLLFLLAGISYYKTTAAPLIDLGTTSTTADERAFLLTYFQDGLGEFAYRNQIDLSQLSIVGPESDTPASPNYAPETHRPLIPFGGGIDSIVTVESLRSGNPEATLCVVHPPGDRFAAIEDAAAVTGLPMVRIERAIDPLVRRSVELGFLNGHVPITAVITATAVVAAILGRHDAVVLSNEWSASVPTLFDGERPINHQWSKGESFEIAFSELVTNAVGPKLSVFSYLRPRSELWVAEQFSKLKQFHGAFRSCNRAFHQSAAERLDHWCGRCDKCCFIDLILAPFMEVGALAAVFGGGEPLTVDENLPRFESLLGLEPDAKPFECVGDVDECRVAVVLAAGRSDRQSSLLLQELSRQVQSAFGDVTVGGATLLAPMGPHYIPERYAARDLLARAR